MNRLAFTLIIGLFPALISGGAVAQALSLAQAEALWREHNIDLKLARTAIAGARGDLAAADRRENPNLSLSAISLSPRAGLGGGGLRDKNADSVVRLEQLFERGSKRQFRTESAGSRLAAAEADAKETERAGIIALHGAYWDLKFGGEREALGLATAQLARDALAAAEKRLQGGDIAAADVSKLRVDAMRAENDARVAVADRQKAQLALALLLGRGEGGDALAATDPWPGPEEPRGADASGDARLESRPDIRAADLRVAAAEAALRSARSLGKRDVTVGLQFEHFPAAGDSAPNNTWGVSVSIPLFAGHAYEGEIIRASADLDQARDQAARARATARAEAGRARADLDASAERVRRFTSQLLPEAEKVAAAAEFAYRKGATGLLDLLDARRTLRQVQQETVAARSDYAKALSALRQQLADSRPDTE